MSIELKPAIIKLKLDYDNCFRSIISFKIDNTPFYTKAVIDTGCSHSMVSADLIFKKSIIDQLEDAEIYNYLQTKKRFIRAYGVTDEVIENDEITTFNQAKHNSTVRFPRPVTDIEIAGYNIGEGNISISYSTKGIALIGMNLLRNLYSFIGPSKGKVVYIAARKDDKDAIMQLNSTIEDIMDTRNTSN